MISRGFSHAKSKCSEPASSILSIGARVLQQPNTLFLNSSHVSIQIHSMERISFTRSVTTPSAHVESQLLHHFSNMRGCPLQSARGSRDRAIYMITRVLQFSDGQSPTRLLSGGRVRASPECVNAHMKTCLWWPAGQWTEGSCGWHVRCCP